MSARAGGRAIHDHRARCSGQVRRRGRHQDRRIVEVDGVLAVATPAEEGPAGQPQEHHRATDQADDRVDLAGALEGVGVLGRRRGADLLERGGECRVEVAGRERRQHVVLEDRLTLLVRQEGGLEARAGVELDLAVLEIRLHVEEDDQPVVEALATDAPLVHQGPRLRLGLLGRRKAATVLGVDDDLGARPRLDPVDRGLRGGDRLGRQDARVVVDGPVDLGSWERWAGRRRGWRRRRGGRTAGRDREQPHQRGKHGDRRSMASHALNPEAAPTTLRAGRDAGDRPSPRRPAGPSAGRCRSTRATRRRRLPR